VLDEVVGRVKAILGENFVGAYITGSFALGAGDLHSDCDFLVVTAVRVDADQEQALRGLHDELPTRPEHWAQHLEGSYAPKRDLQTLAGLGEPWLYIDHGWLADKSGLVRTAMTVRLPGGDREHQAVARRALILGYPRRGADSRA
jgi:hypothetical protein